MNTYLNALKSSTNYTMTENGAVTHKSTLSKLYDMFALGGAYRSRTDADCVLLFKNAYDENPLYALKCLFYLRNIRGGQGERRFFRVCLKWLANAHTDVVVANMLNVPLFGRWDDLYCLYGTKAWNEAVNQMKKQLVLDLESKTPSLLGKWMKSENASSPETKKLASATRQALGVTSRQYRKMLSELRKKINIVERLMSQNEWDKIEFDKLPSQAGIRYKNAFARHDVTRARYEAFAKDENTKVNAGALAPYEVVEKALDVMGRYSWGRNKVALDDTNRLMVNKYWDNLTDYFADANLNALCMIDTSGSMWGTPINVAISLGLYCAEHCNGPFANYYLSFASRPQLIETSGVDFCDKVHRIFKTNLVDNTNIEAAFDLLLDSAVSNHVPQEELPQNLIVISDMEFDHCQTSRRYTGINGAETLMECIAEKWKAAGYRVPKLVFWNVDARQDNIPMKDGKNVTFVSGFSASTFKQVITGKTGMDLMMDTLNDSMYDSVVLA